MSKLFWQCSTKTTRFNLAAPHKVILAMISLLKHFCHVFNIKTKLSCQMVRLFSRCLPIVFTLIRCWLTLLTVRLNLTPNCRNLCWNATGKVKFLEKSFKVFGFSEKQMSFSEKNHYIFQIC